MNGIEWILWAGSMVLFAITQRDLSRLAKGVLRLQAIVGDTMDRVEALEDEGRDHETAE